MAKTLAGKPEPSLGLGKATTTKAPYSGTLSRLVRHKHLFDLNCFNPIMVRLRLTAIGHDPTDTDPFQSHYGAIATVLPLQTRVGGYMFQSHYGAIATSTGAETSDAKAQFQSHYGAIATK